MTWLSITDAKKQGIDVNLLSTGAADAMKQRAESVPTNPADREEARRNVIAAISANELKLGDVTLAGPAVGHFLLKGS